MMTKLNHLSPETRLMHTVAILKLTCTACTFACIIEVVSRTLVVHCVRAGIICQLNARTSVLAAANPVESQWNRNKTIIDNIQLPHTLLSRFDLIFLMLDPQEEGHDQRLGTSTTLAALHTAYCTLDSNHSFYS